MTDDSWLRFEERMRSLDDRALLRLVIFEWPDYLPEAIAIAEGELRRRNLSPRTPEQYWQVYPRERIGPEGFCQDCLAETTPEVPGSVITFQGTGTRLLGDRDSCSACGSVVQRKWVCVVVPIVPLDKYRIIYLKRDSILSDRYIGRKLKPSR